MNFTRKMSAVLDQVYINKHGGIFTLEFASLRISFYSLSPSILNFIYILYALSDGNWPEPGVTYNTCCLGNKRNQFYCIFLFSNLTKFPPNCKFVRAASSSSDIVYQL